MANIFHIIPSNLNINKEEIVLLVPCELEKKHNYSLNLKMFLLYYLGNLTFFLSNLIAIKFHYSKRSWISFKV